jgi:23S rRNA G2069 N7-methylase RlmK/C1962 C5-methylase RlmI
MSYIQNCDALRLYRTRAGRLPPCRLRVASTVAVAAAAPRGGGRSGSRGRGGGHGGANRSRTPSPDTSDILGDAATRLDLPRVAVQRGLAKLFRGGSPVVYPNSVAGITGTRRPGAGDMVCVTDGADRALGWGVYNPSSHFRVRILQRAAEVEREWRKTDSSEVSEASSPSSRSMSLPTNMLSLEYLVSQRVALAVRVRAALGLTTQPETTVYRLINSEGDGLSGLVVDRLGDTLVAQCSAIWIQRQKDTVIARLVEHTGVAEDKIVWRVLGEMMAKEGVRGEQEEEEKEEGATAGEVEDEESSSHRSSFPVVVVRELGLEYEADPWGQKTGFYADQRESRAFLRSITRGKRVLDVCCYRLVRRTKEIDTTLRDRNITVIVRSLTDLLMFVLVYSHSSSPRSSGGFALNAATGGATHVVGVDSSAAAIDLATRNATRNRLDDRVTFIRADMATYLREALARGEIYDVVVLDPPKLAPTRGTLNRATRKYASLNAAAARLVAPGGFLMTCSCSGAMTQSGTFGDMVALAVEGTGRRLTWLRRAGASPCHVTSPHYPEGTYLSNYTAVLN